MTNAKRLMMLIGFLAVSQLFTVSAQEKQTVSDKDIKIVDYEEMRYPTVARNAHVQGMVVIRVKLDDQGKVVDATAISGSEFLVRDSIENAKKWRFKPNTQKSAAIIYNFTLPGGFCKSQGSLFLQQGANVATIIGCDVPVETDKTGR